MATIDRTSFIETITSYVGQEKEVAMSSRLFYDLELDSFDILALICKIEEEYCLSIDITHAAPIDTVDDLHRYIQTYSVRS